MRLRRFLLAWCTLWFTPAALPLPADLNYGDVHWEGKVECTAVLPDSSRKFLKSLLDNATIGLFPWVTETAIISQEENPFGALMNKLFGYLDSDVLHLKSPRSPFPAMHVREDPSTTAHLRTAVEHPLLKEGLIIKINNTVREIRQNRSTESFKQAVPVINDSAAMPSSWPASKARVVIAHYHKTGTVFSQLFFPLLSAWQGLGMCDYVNVDRERKQPVEFNHGRSMGQMWADPIPAAAGTVSRISHPSPTWVKPPGAKLIHWYRNPIKMVLSAYRYHRSSSSAEMWENTTAMCHMCDEHSAKAIFESCEYECSYFELLSSASMATGLALEALNARQTINAMVSNFQRWQGDDVLHLSVDHLADNFTETVSCILRFLEMPIAKPFIALLEAADEKHKNLTNYRHITTGKFDNTALSAWVVNHPIWGREVEVVQHLEMAVFERQRRLYKCPMMEGMFEGLSNKAPVVAAAVNEVDDVIAKLENDVNALTTEFSVFTGTSEEKFKKKSQARRMSEGALSLDGAEDMAALSFA